MLFSTKSIQYAVYIFLSMQVVTQALVIPVRATSAKHNKNSVARRDVSDFVLGALGTKLYTKIQKIGKDDDDDDKKKGTSSETKSKPTEPAPVANPNSQGNQVADETLSSQGNVGRPANLESPVSQGQGTAIPQGNVASLRAAPQGVAPQGVAPQGAAPLGAAPLGADLDSTGVPLA